MKKRKDEKEEKEKEKEKDILWFLSVYHDVVS